MYAHTYLNNLDMDRLEEVLETPHHVLERGQGKTMGFVAKMVGEAMVGEGWNHLYIGPRQPFCKDVMMSVVEILRHWQLPVVPYIQQNRFCIEADHTDRWFRFVSIGGLDYHTFQGPYLDALWVDIDPWVEYGGPRERELLARAHAQLRVEDR